MIRTEYAPEIHVRVASASSSDRVKKRGRSAIARNVARCLVGAMALAISTMAFEDRLPISIHAVQLYDGLGTVLLVAIVLAVGVANTRSIVLPAKGIALTFPPSEAFDMDFPARRATNASWLVNPAAACLFFMFMGVMLSWLYGDLARWSDLAVRLVASAVITVALVIGGDALLARWLDGKRASRTALWMAAALWISLGGAAIAGASGANIRTRSHVWRGRMSLRAAQRACSVEAAFLMRGVVRSTTDIAILQCRGCHCEGGFLLHARARESLDLIIRSGSGTMTEDLTEARLLPTGGSVAFVFTGQRVAGTLSLDAIAERTPTVSGELARTVE